MLVISVGCQSSLAERAPLAIANEETASGKNSLQVNSDVNLTLNSFPNKLTVFEIQNLNILSYFVKFLRDRTNTFLVRIVPTCEF